MTCRWRTACTRTTFSRTRRTTASGWRCGPERRGIPDRRIDIRRSGPKREADVEHASPATEGAAPAMTSQPPQPDPANTPDLEPGGGAAPGTTPPAAAQTSCVALRQPPGGGGMTPTGMVTVIAVCVFVV